MGGDFKLVVGVDWEGMVGGDFKLVVVADWEGVMGGDWEEGVVGVCSSAALELLYWVPLLMSSVKTSTWL